MRAGALLGVLEDPANSAAIAEQARRYAGEGFDSLWVPQAIGRGFLLPDPLITLTAAAVATANEAQPPELGTAVLQLPLYHPVDLAYRVFSLQQIAGGRLTLGVGAGSTQQDFDAFDRSFSERFSTFSDSLRDLREVLQTGSLGDVALGPWPAVQGGPRLVLGSWGKGVARAAEEFDGWMASAAYRTPDEVVAAHARYREAGGQRAIVSTIRVGGDADLGALREMIAQFAQAGFDDAVFLLLPGASDPAAIRAMVS